MADEPVRRGPSRSVSWLLRSGLALATALLLAGVIAKLATGDPSAPAVDPLPVPDVTGPANALLAAGTAVLVATPLLRVVLLVVLWIRERDWRFVAVASAVLGLLVLAALLGEG